MPGLTKFMLAYLAARLTYIAVSMNTLRPSAESSGEGRMVSVPRIKPFMGHLLVSDPWNVMFLLRCSTVFMPDDANSSIADVSSSAVNISTTCGLHQTTDIAQRSSCNLRAVAIVARSTHVVVSFPFQKGIAGHSNEPVYLLHFFKVATWCFTPSEQTITSCI